MSLFGLTFDINDRVINRPRANLPDVYGMVGEGRLVDGPLVKCRPAGVDHGSDSDDHLGGEGHGLGHDFDTAVGRLEDDHLADAGHDFDRVHGRLVGDPPAGAGLGFGMVDGHPVVGHPEGDRLEDVDHDFDTVDARLVDGLPEGADHDFGTDARLAGLDRVAGLRVSRYRRHRAHTSCGIQLGSHLERGVDAGHGFDRVRGHLVGDLPADAGHDFDRADDHLVDDPLEGADPDFEMVDDPLVGDLRQDVVYEDLPHGCRNCHRVGQRCRDVFHRRPDEHCHAACECLDELHRHPLGR